MGSPIATRWPSTSPRRPSLTCASSRRPSEDRVFASFTLVSRNKDFWCQIPVVRQRQEWVRKGEFAGDLIYGAAGGQTPDSSIFGIIDGGQSLPNSVGRVRRDYAHRNRSAGEI